MRGYPSVIFCTAGLHIDEQEATRFLLLSPEVSQQKIREGITATIRKEADSDSFNSWLNENPGRALLKERVRAIKIENITEINIADSERITEKFLGENKLLKPRHQRDIKRLLSLVKAFALLNVWWRERSGSVIVANEADIDAAFALWDKISESQELNLPPYIFNLYNEVILVAWKEKNDYAGELSSEFNGNSGVTRQEVLTKHYAVYGRMLDNNQLRQQILPMLETAGLIVQEQDATDKRKILIYPSLLRQASTEAALEINSEIEGGVEDNPFEFHEETLGFDKEETDC